MALNIRSVMTLGFKGIDIMNHDVYVWLGPIYGQTLRIHSSSMWCSPVRGFHFYPWSLATTRLFAPSSVILMLLTIWEMETVVIMCQCITSYQTNPMCTKISYTVT